jgi:hypothetical protein
MVIGSSHTIDSYEIPTLPEPAIPEDVSFGIFDSAPSSTIPGSLPPKHCFQLFSKRLRLSKVPPCPKLDALELH